MHNIKHKHIQKLHWRRCLPLLVLSICMGNVMGTNFFSRLRAKHIADKQPVQQPQRPGVMAHRSERKAETRGQAPERRADIRGQPSMNRKNSRAQLNKYAYIPDNYSSLEQVTAALRESGVESTNLIIGIDFTKSNEWTGKNSFQNQSLHKIGERPNPYEQAITIIGKTLAPFDEDNLIPCFGFGDATTHDQQVFSFHSDGSSCHGFEEVLACYRKIVPHLKLSGPTSFAPLVEAAVDIVDRSGGLYHVLVIIADGQVTRSVETNIGDLSPQEKSTIDSIVMASVYPLSIVLVGVGDGPWDDMRKFDDKIPARTFDNFQFVNFTFVMEKNANPAEKEASFALAALMEIPIQYKAAIELGLLGRTRGTAKRVMPRPPPLPSAQRQQVPSAQLQQMPSSQGQQVPSSQGQQVPNVPQRLQSRNRDQACPICLTNEKNLAFGCGHMCCSECGQSLSRCPICRQAITSRLRLYSG